MTFSTIHQITSLNMSLKTLMQLYVQRQGLDEFEGDYSTAIENVRFYRSAKGHQRKPTMYKSGLIVLGQGTKTVYAGGESIPYGEGDCLMMGVPIPVECEAVPNHEQPILGIGVEIPMHILQRQVGQIKASMDRKALDKQSEQLTICCEPIDAKLNKACERLMEALCDDLEAKVLGESLLEEVVFFALLSNGGNILFNLADNEGKYARIAATLKHIHTRYSESLTVSELASIANMSISSFHTAFRLVTLESPVQYIKKVRLNRGRDLICFEGKRVNEAAEIVGYSSAEQFSREFKRHFNQTPTKAALSL